jgi:hypothetical protein
MQNIMQRLLNSFDQFVKCPQLIKVEPPNPQRKELQPKGRQIRAQPLRNS